MSGLQPFDLRAFDIVVFGATGFSGKLLAKYLVKNYLSQAKIAFAGRNQAKLEAVRSELAQAEPLAENIPILIGNSDDLEQLVAIAAQTRCVASTVGPYAKYGTPLVEACATSGTSYCDLTGEAGWHAMMFNRFEKEASRTGARIVHQAGFDSVPSDIGTMAAAANFKQRYGRDPAEIAMFIGIRGSGGLQGGTVDTVINELSNSKQLREARKASEVGAPPVPKKGQTRLHWTKGLFWSRAVRRWCLPFFMAGANLPYVARSNGRLKYSSNLVYSEQMMSRSFIKALFMYIVLLVGGILLFIPPTRWLLQRFVLPAPGQGPSMETCERTSYQMIFAATEGQDQASVTLNAIGDPSCISTTCCLAETAMSLSVDAHKLNSDGGVMTAAYAVGPVLLERLRATPLFTIEADGDHGGAKAKM